MPPMQSWTAKLCDETRDLTAIVRSATPELAADEAMNSWVAGGSVGVDEMPIDVIVRDGADGAARRFRAEAPPAFLMLEVNACRVCGCTDDAACDPPCAWADDDLCDNPSCLEAAGKS